MNLWKINDLKSALKNDIITVLSSLKSEINEVVIDSRKKTNLGLFVAIKGENNDGHDFLEQVFENGAIAALVEKIPAKFENDPRLILVKNSIQALENLAIAARNRFQGKIIAVTGSVGKTSVKEMLKAVFLTQGTTFATSGNLNNHFGLPLSLANLPADYDYGIFEMGMNHLGEIEPLSKMAKPHVAIITTVTSAHIGNFKNEEEIALAKSEIFSGLLSGGFAIINNENKHIEFLKTKAAQGNNFHQITTFGSKETSNIRLYTIENIDINHSKVSLRINGAKEQISYVINSINETTICNSLIVVACLKLVGKNFANVFEDGLLALSKLETPKGRGNIIKTNKNNLNLTIIDDSYNANLSSMIAGLKFLSNLKNFQPNSRIIIAIGDMLEMGVVAKSEHQAIAHYILENKIDGVFLVGEMMAELIPLLPKEKILGQFNKSSELAENLLSSLQDNDILFVKGSRGTRMDKIVDKLINN